MEAASRPDAVNGTGVKMFDTAKMPMGICGSDAGSAKSTFAGTVKVRLEACSMQVNIAPTFWGVEVTEKPMI